MAGRKRKLKPGYFIAGVIVVVLVLLANLADKNLMPSFLQRPVDSLNKATGGVIYAQQLQPLRNLSVHIIDVGQGDSIFIYCDGENMLIDGGPGVADGKTDAYLKSYGITSLKYLIATHPHEDHIGGLPAVLGNIKSQTLIMPDATTNTSIFTDFLNIIKLKGLKATKPVPGTKYSLGGGSFTILAPNASYDDLNNMSVVIRFVYKNNSVLFTGDCSKASEEDILKKGFELKSDVLKVGHHGSTTATSDAFLKAVKPSLAVISAGKNNIYKLPDNSTLIKLKAAGVKTLRTDQSGTIIIESDGDKITYTTEK